MDGGCYAIDCLRLLGPGEPSVTRRWPTRALGGAAWLWLAGPVGGRPGDGGAAGLSGRGPGWFESAFTRDGEFRADVHVSCEDGTVWVRDFIRAHWGRLVAVRHGSVLADERGGGDHDLRRAVARVRGGDRLRGLRFRRRRPMR